MADEASIFADALECETPAARRAYLEDVCANDPALKTRMIELLAAHEQAGSILDLPAEPPLELLIEQLPDGPGTLVGPYKLLELIGEGGMGLVYRAEQQHPIRRQVAVKIIKPGMDTRQVIARFEVERHALAMLDHPHIAKVYDAGMTENGRSYFVMELVRGVGIVEFCDAAQLNTRARLELFISVCQGVQHAHWGGIIHRDLKPANILVTMHDDRPVPKIIDFGIAKATGQRLTDQTLFTNFLQLLGTPVYMSPEQAQR
ncbi:MAG: serine/threonine-protein kinase, partial [Planctomycetaceae bacterium]